MPDEVVVVGGGPAGAIAALLLARRGVAVRLFDRAVFPRDKLCGDSLNPGALRILARHGLDGEVTRRSLPVEGMIVTGPTGVTIEGRYPPGVLGRSLRRCDLDACLLAAAERAGVVTQSAVRVTGAVTESTGGETRVVGIRTSTTRHAARIVIAADGRHSTLAFQLRLARHPRQPRRWAIGAYFEGVSGQTACGEMHVRERGYIGVAPVPGGLTNACLVVPARRARQMLSSPAAALEAALAADPLLADRFRMARRVTGARVLGPLAVDASAAGVPGLLLAGDAAGFIDPMTGDGMRLAMRSGELAAEAALRALAGQADAEHWLARRRQEEFGQKMRVNRALRALAARPGAVAIAARGAALAPSILRRIIAYAGDVYLEEPEADGVSVVAAG